MSKKQKNNLIRIIVAAVLVAALHFLHYVPQFAELGRPVMLVLYLVPYLVVGHDILRKAYKGIVNRQPLDENLLMAIATLGALALALTKTGDFTEAVAVMLFYQIGELFQSYAVGRSRRNIGELMDIRPDYANIEGEDGIERVDPDEVEIGTVIVVQPGEKVPIDGIVEEGNASLDTSALTGESVPRTVREGDEVISGCINMNGVLRIRTTQEFDESTASKILELVENASSRKSRSENFISRFARIYTPVVVGYAVALAILPPVIRIAALGLGGDWGIWVYRALTFLVVSCPCALVISIPLSFFAGIGGASREGVLVKGSNFLEAMSKVKTVVMDKTGTLTQGVFEVVKVCPAEAGTSVQVSEATADSGASADAKAGATELNDTSVGSPAAAELTDASAWTPAAAELLHLAAHAERHSSHPIALALRLAYEEYCMEHGAPTAEHDGCDVEILEEIAGHGIRAQVDGHEVSVGNQKMMKLAIAGDAGAAPANAPAEGTAPAGTADTTSSAEANGADEAASASAAEAGTVIHVAVDGRYAGYIVISDVIKESAPEAIRRMKAIGVSRIVMLTGDNRATAEAVAQQLGITEVRSELLPADKVSQVEELLREMGGAATATDQAEAAAASPTETTTSNQTETPAADEKDNALKADDPRRARLAFVGDGINDAPVLSRADIGIAMGALGSDAAIEAADVVLMDDDPRKIPKAIRISRKCMRIVKENIWFAIGVKVLCLILCALGIVGMWAAIFADVGVMVLAVLNAMRTLFVKKL